MRTVASRQLCKVLLKRAGSPPSGVHCPVQSSHSLGLVNMTALGRMFWFLSVALGWSAEARRSTAMRPYRASVMGRLRHDMLQHPRSRRRRR